MAYSTALEEEEEAGWQCCMPPRGSFGVLTHAQGAAEGVRSRDNPPPQPRPVEAPLSTAIVWGGDPPIFVYRCVLECKNAF